MPKANRAERRMPVRTAVVEGSGDYEGWKATVRVNPPLFVWEDINSEDWERLKTGIVAVVLDWNYVDEEGQPLPSPAEGGLRLCPPDLLTQLAQGWRRAVDEAASVPKNVAGALEAFLADQHMEPGLREGVGCPADYANIILGERFGHWPWEIEEAPVDRVLYYRRLLGCEAETQALLADLPVNERLISMDDEV